MKPLRLLLARLRGYLRIRNNQCPACNSDAPEVDDCPICDSYDWTPQHTEYPPAGWRKMEWRKRYGSYLNANVDASPPLTPQDHAKR